MERSHVDLAIIPIFSVRGTDHVFTFFKKVSYRNRVLLAFEWQETLVTRMGHIGLLYDYPRLIETFTKKMRFSEPPIYSEQ